MSLANFQLRFPVMVLPPASALPDTAEIHSVPVPKMSGRIVVVDDDGLIINVSKEFILCHDTLVPLLWRCLYKI